MNILIVGGTGMIGGKTALHLQSLGHDVTIASRSKPVDTAVAHLPFLACNYIEDDCTDGRLEGFDAVVHAAAADPRLLPQDGSVSPEDFYHRANTVAVPRFFEAARDAGVGVGIYIGSFYSHVAPERAAVCPYVKSRVETDAAVIAMNSDSFRVCSLAAPFVLGVLQGVPVPHLGGMLAYVTGQLGLPMFAPPGGTNHISAQSLAEATAGALERGVGGTPYLVGDENYSHKAYMELWAELAGTPLELEVREEDHPIMPDAFMFAGVGATVSHEPDPEETALLGYSRNQIRQEIADVIAALS